jgi:hypothetical protein
MSTRAQLKAFFQTGDVPTEVQFADLIDSMAIVNSDTLVSPNLGTPSSGVATNLTGNAAGLTAGEATAALGIKTATTTVVLSAATAPTAGQVLTASSTTLAAWATPSGGGGIPTAITVANEASDTTCFLAFVTAATGDLGPKTNAALTFNASTASLACTTFVGALTGTASNVTTNANLTGHVTSVGNAAVLGSFTKAQLDAAVSDGNVLYVGDVGPFALVTEATTARTLLLTDAQKYIRCTSASATSVTVPPQASVAWVADTEIVVERAGTGSLTIVAGASVTLQSPRTLVADVRYSAVTLKRVALNEWVVAGGTV